MHKKIDEVMDILRTRVINAKNADVPLSIHWSDVESLLDIVEARQTGFDRQLNTINALEGQIRAQRAELL